MSTDALLPLADAAGRQAGVWFVLLLLALLCGTALLGRLWQRHVWPRTHDGPPRPARLLLGLVAGFALLLGAAAVFAEIAERSSDGTGMARLDEALSLALRAHTGPRTLQLFRALTRLGDAAVLVPLSVVVALPLWWRGRAALALAWLLALGGNALLIALLKRVFERARPLHDHGLVSEPGFSFPSGHAAGATVAYGMLAYLGLRVLPPRWHVPVLMLAAALAFSVGGSRVFLQLHYVSDVLAGFAWGAAWLALCVLSVELSRRWRRRR
jgi:undecaprenyl-diphosphatase